MTDHDDPESFKAPLIDHLIELRNRLMYSGIALLVGVVIAYFFSEQIYNFLVHPLAKAMGNDPNSTQRLIYTSLTETFFTYLRVAFFGGFFLAFPVIGYQLWRFVAPGLYRRERQAFLPYLVASPLLFLAGATFVYYVIFPVAWRFFLGFQQPAGPGELAIQLEARVSDYLSLVLTLMFAFGITFQMPVALTLLARVGLLGSQQLRHFRRYAIVLVFAAAAVLTPPDVFSQLSLAVPGCLLYEISIWLVRGIERRRAEAHAASEASDGETSSTS